MSMIGKTLGHYRSRSLRYGACCSGIVCVFLVMTSIVFASSSEPQAAPQPTSFLLESGKAGPFEIGATVDEIYSLVGRDHVRLVALFMEGMFEPVLEIQVPGLSTGPAIVAHIREWPCAKFSVWGIEVRDRRFRTREGIGIGSTLGELRKHYKVEMGGLAESDKVSALVPSINLTFRLDAVLKATNLSKIELVWLWPQPKEVRKRRCPDFGPLP